MKTQAFRAATVFLLLGALTGCGQGSLLSGASGGGLDADSEAMQAMRMGRHPGAHGFMGHGGPRQGAHAPGVGFLMGLDLSEEQQEQLREIFDTYRPAKPENEATPGESLAELLEAESLDVEALRAALAEGAQRPAAVPGMPAEALVAVREVLTEAQRAEVVSRVSEMPLPSVDERPQAPSSGDRLDRIATSMNLTDAQQAALDAFKAKLSAPSQPAEDSQAHRDALIALFETGDATALKALTPSEAEAPAFPVEEFVALAQVLSAEQRLALLAPPHHGQRFAPSMRDGAGPGARWIAR